MTDRDWFELVVWGCTIGVVAATAIMGIIVGSAMNRIKRKAILKRLKGDHDG